MMFSEPVEFVVDAPFDVVAARLSERTHWRAIRQGRWSRRLDGRVQATHFKLRLTFPLYTAGNAVVEGDLLDQGAATVVRGRVRPGAFASSVVVAFTILFVVLLPLSIQNNGLLETVGVSAVMFMLPVIHIVGYWRNRRHAARLLMDATADV